MVLPAAQRQSGLGAKVQSRAEKTQLAAQKRLPQSQGEPMIEQRAMQMLELDLEVSSLSEVALAAQTLMHRVEETTCSRRPQIMADKVAIKTQLDFYFSDSNYPRDKFLRSTAAQHDGCAFSSLMTSTPTLFRSLGCFKTIFILKIINNVLVVVRDRSRAQLVLHGVFSHLFLS